jgi:hypothetical protein
LLCKYELGKFADCEDEINGDVYKWDETADEWACDEVAASDALTDDDCKSYFAGELMDDECECMLESGDVIGYEAWDGWWWWWCVMGEMWFFGELCNNLGLPDNINLGFPLMFEFELDFISSWWWWWWWCMSSFLTKPITSGPLPAFFGFRFLVWIPSFRIASGRLIPCNLKYNPQALQTGSPSLFRRQSVVVRVPQFVQHKPKRLVAVCYKGKWKKINKSNVQNIFKASNTNVLIQTRRTSRIENYFSVKCSPVFCWA